MRLHVSNFPYETDSEDLRNLFASYGATSARVMRDHADPDYIDGRPLGYGFVDVAEGERAMAEMNGTQYGGRRLDVRPARQRVEVKA